MDDTQKTELVYKKYLDLPVGFVNTFYSADTALGSSTKNLNKKNIRSQPIPATAPTLLGLPVSITNGSYREAIGATHMRKYTLTLSSIQTNKTFWYASTDPNDPEGTNLCRGAIPSTFDPLGSYNITVKANGTTVSANYTDYPWNFDVDAGVLTFYPLITIPTPITITFWRYVGNYNDSETVLYDSTTSNYWTIKSIGDTLIFTSSTTSTVFYLAPSGFMILGATDSVGAGIRLNDQSTTNYWDVYSDANKYTLSYNGTPEYDFTSSGVITLKGSAPSLIFLEATTNDQRFYWNSSYGLILDSPTTTSFGGRLLLNQLTMKGGVGYWNHQTGIHMGNLGLDTVSKLNLTDQTNNLNYWDIESMGSTIYYNYNLATKMSISNGGLLALTGTAAGLTLSSRTDPTNYYMYIYHDGTSTRFEGESSGYVWSIVQDRNGLVAIDGGTGTGLKIFDRTTAYAWSYIPNGDILYWQFNGATNANKMWLSSTGALRVSGTDSSLILSDQTVGYFWTLFSESNIFKIRHSVQTTVNSLTLSAYGRCILDGTDCTLQINDRTTTSTITMSSTGDLFRINSSVNNYDIFQLSPVVSIQGLGTTYNTAQLRIVNAATSSCGALNLFSTTAKVGLFYNNTPDRLFACNTGVAGTAGPYLASGSTAWITSSDRRMKHDITSLTPSLSRILQLNPVSFKWNDNDKEECGLIAQEVLEVIPEVVEVSNDSETMMGISYNQLIPFLIKSIQEQQTLIVSLTERVAALELKCQGI